MAAPDGIALIDGATAVVLGMLAGSAGRTGAPEILGAGFSKVDSTAGSAVGDTAADFTCSWAGCESSGSVCFLASSAAPPVVGLASPLVSAFADCEPGRIAAILFFSTRMYPKSVLILNMLLSYATMVPKNVLPSFNWISSDFAGRAAAQIAASSTPRVSTLIIVSMLLGSIAMQSLRRFGVGLVTTARRGQTLWIRCFAVTGTRAERPLGAASAAEAGGSGRAYTTTPRSCPSYSYLRTIATGARSLRSRRLL